VGICGDEEGVSVTPFVIEERRVCGAGFTSGWGRFRRISCANVKKDVAALYGCVPTGRFASIPFVATNKSSCD
jgi:hypothetical protein